MNTENISGTKVPPIVTNTHLNSVVTILKQIIVYESINNLFPLFFKNMLSVSLTSLSALKLMRFSSEDSGFVWFDERDKKNGGRLQLTLHNLNQETLQPKVIIELSDEDFIVYPDLIKIVEYKCEYTSMVLVLQINNADFIKKYKSTKLYPKLFNLRIIVIYSDTYQYFGSPPFRFYSKLNSSQKNKDSSIMSRVPLIHMLPNNSYEIIEYVNDHY